MLAEEGIDAEVCHMRLIGENVNALRVSWLLYPYR